MLRASPGYHVSYLGSADRDFGTGAGSAHPTAHDPARRLASEMRFRIPFLMKKRGERRTGARWLGRVGEAVVFVLLISAGVLALLLLFLGALSPPWPWLIAVIPVSLIVYGVLGLVEVIWQSSTSSELRSAVARRAGDLESRLVSESAAHQLPTVPSIAMVVDSPGIHLAHRLPIDASPNLLLFGMTLMGIGWNLLVAMFVYQVVEQHRRAEPDWLLTWLMVPLVLAGVWTLAALAREIWMSTGIGSTRVEISAHPLRPDRSYRIFISQTGRVSVRWLKVLMVCEERATYSQGTDTRTEVVCVYRHLLHRARKFEIQSDQPFAAENDYRVPIGAMHSFRSPHNSVDWTVLVRGKVARWPIFERRFPVYVYPEDVLDAAPSRDRTLVAQD